MDDDSLEEETIKATLNSDLDHLLAKFSEPLKANFENQSLWLRFSLALMLINKTKPNRNPPHSALQSFQECLRIDPIDPTPALMACKLVLEQSDEDLDKALFFAEESIRRCKNLEKNNSTDSQNTYHTVSNINIKQLLARSYLFAGIIHAHIYERNSESIKSIKLEHYEKSLEFIDLAKENNPNDHLIYFHHALHDARRQSYVGAIQNLKKSIELNPNHLRSFQLLILSLSGLKHYNEALILCESSLTEFTDDLVLLITKCNLEQCLVDKKGYSCAMATAQYILRYIRKNKNFSSADSSLSEKELTKKNSENSQPPNQNSVHQTGGTNNTATSLISNNNASIQYFQAGNSITGASQDNQKGYINLFANPFRHHIDDDVALLSEEATIWLLVAEIFIRIGSLSDAELCVDEGSNHTKEALSDNILFLRGLVSKEKNNLMEAKSYFQSCLALNYKHSRALQQVGHVYYKLGEYSIAEKYLQDSLDLNACSYKTWHYLSQVYIQTKQHDKARDCEKKASYHEERSTVIPLSFIPRLTLE